MARTLFVVATPIGNLEDITLRALRILRDEVAVIACEDTRQSSKLLQHFEIRKPLVSYHDHNEAQRTTELMERIKAGENVALISDAGTPLISDPGFRIVQAAIADGFAVVPVPGPCAAVAALSASGLPTDNFRFAGFVPAKSASRRKFFEELSAETTLVYESPHRILESMEELAAHHATRAVVLARELTKLHEEFLRGTASEVLQALQARPMSQKGEFTLLIGPATQAAQTLDAAAEVARLESGGTPRMEAIKSVAKRMGVPKRTVYQLVEERDNNPAGKHRD